ncbi:MAG: M48 family metalloprotease [Armatimonadota bacterium]|nr:M48 family metalloprotease [bacterium]
MYEQIQSNIWRSRLLIVGFIVLIGLVGYGFYLAYGDPIALIIAVGFAFATSIGSYYYSDQIVLASTQARPATKEEFPHYVNSVEGLALAAGIPVPKAYVIDDPAPNAFATGRDPEHGVICVTTGLLDIMNRVELEGVISHEMSHIKNYDIRFMALVAVLVGAIAMLAHWFWWSGRFGGYGRSDRDDEGQGQVIFFIIGMVLAILAPIAAGLVQAMISRRREYLADASGAMLTRYPDGLASALEKIANDEHVLRSANKATAHLFISNPLRNLGGVFSFSTHPPIEDRIKRLREM